MGRVKSFDSRRDEQKHGFGDEDAQIVIFVNRDGLHGETGDENQTTPWQGGGDTPRFVLAVQRCQ